MTRRRALDHALEVGEVASAGSALRRVAQPGGAGPGDVGATAVTGKGSLRRVASTARRHAPPSRGIRQLRVAKAPNPHHILLARRARRRTSRPAVRRPTKISGTCPRSSTCPGCALRVGDWPTSGPPGKPHSPGINLRGRYSPGTVTNICTPDNCRSQDYQIFVQLTEYYSQKLQIDGRDDLLKAPSRTRIWVGVYPERHGKRW